MGQKTAKPLHVLLMRWTIGRNAFAFWLWRDVLWLHSHNKVISIHRTRGGGGGGRVLTENKNFTELVLHLLGEERQSHWAFINKAEDIGHGARFWPIRTWFQFRSMSPNQHRILRRCLMHALVIVDAIFNEILKVGIKMAMSMELEI